MVNQDKTLNCQDCGSEFTFTAGEQDFYNQKGFTNEPKRCPSCRNAKKNQRFGAKEMHTVTCEACNKETQVPFKPTGNKPVYCRECYQQKKDAGEI